jgi:Flp pilus assembly protein TadD
MDHSREDRLKLAKHYERAQGWLLLEKYDLAVAALAEIPAVFSGQAEIALLRAEIHMAAAEWTLAEPLLRQLVNADADEPQYWVNLAYVVRRAKSLAEAEPILREACQLFPTVELIWFNLACYAAQQNRLEEARALLGTALRLAPGLKEQAKSDPDLKPYWDGLASGKITTSS